MNVVCLFKSFVKTRITVEHAFYKLIDNVPAFENYGVLGELW